MGAALGAAVPARSQLSARSRNLLLERIPEAIDLLHAAGIEELNFYNLVAPPDLRTDEDDAFATLLTRRPAFELAIRRVAEQEPAVDLRSPAAVEGLLCGDSASEVLRVIGISLAGGERIEADVVLDAGGRRTPVPRWLHEVGVEVPQDVQDCDSTYFTRYYRQHEANAMPQVMLLGAGGAVDRLAFAGFMGENRTFGLALFGQSDDKELRPLRHNAVWEAVVQSIPSLAPWIDPGHAAPIHDVATMTGHQNVRRHYVVDGAPIVHGLLPIGDALCTTNPRYGWGASMALTYAFAAVDAVMAHPDDPAARALACDAAVADEADGVYRESAALGRAFLRRTHLLDAPGAIFDDPEVVAEAKRSQAIVRSKQARKRGPDRDELLAIIQSAMAGSTAT